jgi:hypothetical protein
MGRLLTPVDAYLKRRDQLLFIVNHEPDIDKRIEYLNQLHNCILEIAALTAEHSANNLRAASEIRAHRNFLDDSDTQTLRAADLLTEELHSKGAISRDIKDAVRKALLEILDIPVL